MNNLNKLKTKVRLWHKRCAIAHAYICTRLKHERCAKKSTPCLIKKLQGVRQIARRNKVFHLSKLFERETFKDLTRKSCVFVISLIQWWKLYHIYIFFTQSTTGFNKLKRNMNDGTIVFLTSLLIALTWYILLLSSFWCKK